jgi:hypothetical protein
MDIVHRAQHGLVLDRRGDYRALARCAQRHVRSDDRGVVALGSTGREEHFGRLGAEAGGQALAGIV